MREEGQVSTIQSDVSSFWPDVSTFRPNVSSFGGNVSSFRPNVSTLAGDGLGEEWRGRGVGCEQLVRLIARGGLVAVQVFGCGSVPACAGMTSWLLPGPPFDRLRAGSLGRPNVGGTGRRAG